MGAATPSANAAWHEANTRCVCDWSAALSNTGASRPAVAAWTRHAIASTAASHSACDTTCPRMQACREDSVGARSVGLVSSAAGSPPGSVCATPALARGCMSSALPTAGASPGAKWVASGAVVERPPAPIAVCSGKLLCGGLAAPLLLARDCWCRRAVATRRNATLMPALLLSRWCGVPGAPPSCSGSCTRAVRLAVTWLPCPPRTPPAPRSPGTLDVPVVTPLLVTAAASAAAVSRA